MLMVPLGGDEFYDRVLGLFESGARFANDQLMNLCDIGGRQMAFFAPAIVHPANHTGECRLDVKQRAGHIHQYSVVGRLHALHQCLNHAYLIENDLARLAETQHRQGIGNLFQRDLQRLQIGQRLAVAAHEQIETVLDANQLLAQRGHHRAHRATVGTCQLGALLVDDGTVGQRFIQAVARLQRLNALGLPRRLGHIEQQILDQLVGSGLVDAVRALLDESLEFPVDLAQQRTDGSPVGHATAGKPFDDAGCNLPESAQRGILAEHLEACENPRHEAQVGGQVLIADNPYQRHLQHLPKLAQQCWQIGRLPLRHELGRQRRKPTGHVRHEQAGFRKQLLAARGAQIVEQRQQRHRQVATRALDAVEVRRHLQDRLHQHFQRLGLTGNPAVEQGPCELFHFFGEQGRTVELDHLQGAMDLMDIGQAETHPRRVLRVVDERFQRLSRLLQRLGNFAFHPFQGDIIVPITHSDSAHKLFRVKARTWLSATGIRSGCCQPTTSPTPITSNPPGARRSARRLRISRRRQRRK